MRTRYACFDHFGRNARSYGILTGSGITRSCKAEAVSTLVVAGATGGAVQHGASVRLTPGALAPNVGASHQQRGGRCLKRVADERDGGR